MNTLENAQYVETAIAALAECKTDADLMEWDDQWTNSERYIQLPDALLAKLETTYETRMMDIEAEGLAP